jgi:hypothetical protein
MKHPTPPQLNEYQEGRLDSRRRWEIGDHLQDCADCREEAAALLRVQEALDLLDVPANGHPDDEDLAAVAMGRADAALRQRVLLHLGECPECATVFGQLPRETQSAPRLMPWLGSVAAAAAVMMVLAIFLHLPQGARVTDMSAPPSGAMQRSAEGLAPATPVAPEVAPPPPSAEAVTGSAPTAPAPAKAAQPPFVPEARRDPAPAPAVTLPPAPPARPEASRPALRAAEVRQPSRPAAPVMSRPRQPALRPAGVAAGSEGLTVPVRPLEPTTSKGVSPTPPVAPVATKPFTDGPTRTATGTKATTFPETKPAGHAGTAPPVLPASPKPAGTAAELATRTVPETMGEPVAMPATPTPPTTDSPQTQSLDGAGDTQPLPDLDLEALRNVKIKPPLP